MIENIWVKGFRSLVDFELEIRPGLNVLLGANGAGKTNFVAFLDFLSRLVQHDIHSAFAVAGGASSVFSQEYIDKPQPKLWFKVAGAIADDQPQSSVRRHADSTLNAHSFSYECEIVYDKKIPAIYIGSESIEIARLGGPNVRFSRKTAITDDGFSHTVELAPREDPLFEAMHLNTNPRRHEGKDALEDRFSNYIEGEQSILTFLPREATAFRTIKKNLSSLGSVNIVPSEARSATSVSEYGAIDSDGSGLAAVLYGIQSAQAGNRGYSRGVYHYPPQYAKRVWSSINSWVSEVNPSIKSLSVSVNHASVLFEPRVTFDFKGKQSRFGFEKLSDGTIKWIALVTILFTEASYGTIEEPENFLHPRMQEIFATLAKEVCDSSTSPRAMIVTTHSESLLNQCSPDDIVVFKCGETGTVARRPSNGDELAKLVASSNFGLGYFYRIGGIDV